MPAFDDFFFAVIQAFDGSFMYALVVFIWQLCGQRYDRNGVGFAVLLFSATVIYHVFRISCIEERRLDEERRG